MIALGIFVAVVVILATYQVGVDIGYTRGYHRGQREGGAVGYLQGRQDERRVICGDPAGTLGEDEREMTTGEAYHGGIAG